MCEQNSGKVELEFLLGVFWSLSVCLF